MCHCTCGHIYAPHSQGTPFDQAMEADGDPIEALVLAELQEKVQQHAAASGGAAAQRGTGRGKGAAQGVKPVATKHGYGTVAAV